MSTPAAATHRIEYGDFQTPEALARRVLETVAATGIRPAAILEPTCGRGSLLAAALAAFPAARAALGVEIDPGHAQTARAAVSPLGGAARCRVEIADFFTLDWKARLEALPDPLLVIGNPPWITSAGLGTIGGRNAPPRSNAERVPGLAALTGRSNFDISEWMIERMLSWLAGRRATLAMLCKTQVARRVLERQWKCGAALGTADAWRIDAAVHFGAAVDACLLVVPTSDREAAHECRMYPDLRAPVERTFGLCAGRLVADVATHGRTAHLEGESPAPWRWRSGIKHDCAAVMELREQNGPDGCLVNGLGEHVDVEPEVLWPLIKGAALGGDRPLLAPGTRRFALLPQRTTGEDPAALAEHAPRAWAYLCRHGARLDARRSRVYRARPRFSIFGVGPYTFAPWKLAISGLHKRLRFRVLGPVDGRPCVLDDTGYALPAHTEDEARWLQGLLESEPARAFFEARVFWDAKRPITAGLLGRLDLVALANALGQGDVLARYTAVTSTSRPTAAK